MTNKLLIKLKIKDFFLKSSNNFHFNTTSVNISLKAMFFINKLILVIIII